LLPPPFLFYASPRVIWGVRMKPSRRVCFLAVLALISCPSRVWSQRKANPNFVNSRILVQVRYVSGARAAQGILVRLDVEGGGVVAQEQTDAAGKVTFVPPLPGVYVVLVSEPGYREVERRVDLTIAPTSSLNLELVRLPSERDLSKTPQGLGDMVSVSGLNIPEGALKEFETAQKLLKEQQDVTACIEHLQEAIKMDDSFSQAYTMLGIAYLQRHQWKDAETSLEKAVQLDPKSGTAYLSLGASLNQEKDYAGAEKALRRGLELDPEAPEGHYELGKTYWALGRWQEAEPHAVKAAAMQPNLPSVHVLMGNILLRKRDAQGALKEFQEYLHLAPEGPMAPGARQMVDKIEQAIKQAH